MKEGTFTLGLLPLNDIKILLVWSIMAQASTVKGGGVGGGGWKKAFSAGVHWEPDPQISLTILDA